MKFITLALPLVLATFAAAQDDDTTTSVSPFPVHGGPPKYQSPSPSPTPTVNNNRAGPGSDPSPSPKNSSLFDRIIDSLHLKRDASAEPLNVVVGAPLQFSAGEAGRGRFGTAEHAKRDDDWEDEEEEDWFYGEQDERGD